MPQLNLNTDLRMGHLLDELPMKQEKDWSESDRRAYKAAHALIKYGEADGLIDGDEVETTLSDLMADLLHMCAAAAPNDPGMFDRSVARGRRHYLRELEEARGELNL